MGAKLSGPGGGGHTISQNADINVTPFVDIMLQETGSIFIADKQTTLEGLSADVCAALGGGDPACKEERVFIRADPEVTYNQFMEVMNELQRRGFFKVGLLNEDIE